MITYTRNVKDDQTATYDCGLCGHYSVDVDGARAHHAVHVAGPDLLLALTISRDKLEGEGLGTDAEDEALAKAAPKGT